MRNKKSLLKITYTAIFTAIILLATSLIKFSTGLGEGYIHLGDCFVYLSACILPFPYCLVASASKSSMNRNVHMRPVMSPCLTKKVRSSRRGSVPEITACSHHGVGCVILPDGLMIALIPVFAQRAMALRVSIALNDA